MVSLKSLLASALSLAVLPTSDAYFSHITAPASAPAGSTVQVAVYNQGYSQAILSFGIAWGQTTATTFQDCGSACLGNMIGYTPIYNNPTYNNIPLNAAFNISVKLGSTTGQQLLVAGIPVVTGAYQGSTWMFTTTPITVT